MDKPITNSGNITIQNTGSANTNAVTAGSAVKLDIGGSFSSVAIQIRGTYTGVLTVQITLDGDLWVNLSGAQLLTNRGTGVQSATIASAAQGVWVLNTASIVGVRVTGLAAITGNAAVTLIGGTGDGIIILGAPVPLAAGSAVIGVISTQPGTAYNLVTTASNNLANIKNVAGNLFELTISNPTATPAYVKLYNKASAPIVASDVPVMTIPIPATGAGVGSVFLNFGHNGKRFATGIAIAVTGAVGATDATNAVAGIQVNGSYV